MPLLRTQPLSRTIRVSLLSLLASTTLSVAAQSLHQPPAKTALDRAFWSLTIQDAATGKALIEVRSNHKLTPASTLKVVATGTAYSLLSPQTRIATLLVTMGQIEGDTLRGDMYIVGGGDPSLGSRYLWNTPRDTFFNNAIQALKARGIHTIEGNIVAISPTTDMQAVSPHWLHYDMGNYYAAGAHDLNIFDNTYALSFTDNGKNFSTSPKIPGLNLSAQYALSAQRRSDSIYISIDTRDSSLRSITGIYPMSAKRHVVRGAIPYPPLFVAQYLYDLLGKAGVTVKGSPEMAQRLPQTTMADTLYSYSSPTLHDLCRVTNVYSHNLFAEAIMKLPFRSQAPRPGTSAMQSALEQVLAYWKGRGIDTTNVELYDGCGLSPENKVTTRFLASLLGKIYRSNAGKGFVQTLPLAGKEGTLSIFLKKTPLEGKAHLKSGTIGNVIAYAGYIEAHGRVYTVSFIVNNAPMRAGEVRQEMEKVLLHIFFS